MVAHKIIKSIHCTWTPNVELLINDCARIRGHKHIDKYIYFTMIYFNLSHKYSTMVHKMSLCLIKCVLCLQMYTKMHKTTQPDAHRPYQRCQAFPLRTTFYTIIVICMLKNVVSNHLKNYLVQLTRSSGPSYKMDSDITVQYTVS